MVIQELIDMVIEAYPDLDGAAKTYWDAGAGRPRDGEGDMLIGFIIHEIYDVCGSSIIGREELHDAVVAMTAARRDLDKVLDRLWDELENSDGTV